jgi:hypothetical protein
MAMQASRRKFLGGAATAASVAANQQVEDVPRRDWQGAGNNSPHADWRATSAALSADRLDVDTRYPGWHRKRLLIIC